MNTHFICVRLSNSMIFMRNMFVRRRALKSKLALPSEFTKYTVAKAVESLHHNAESKAQENPIIIK